MDNSIFGLLGDHAPLGFILLIVSISIFFYLKIESFSYDKELFDLYINKWGGLYIYMCVNIYILNEKTPTCVSIYV